MRADPRLKQQRRRRYHFFSGCECHLLCSLPILSESVLALHRMQCLERHFRVGWDKGDLFFVRTIVTAQALVSQVNSGRDLVSGCSIDDVTRTRASIAHQRNLVSIPLGDVRVSEQDVEKWMEFHAVEPVCYPFLLPGGGTIDGVSVLPQWILDVKPDPRVRSDFDTKR